MAGLAALQLVGRAQSPRSPCPSIRLAPPAPSAWAVAAWTGTACAGRPSAFCRSWPGHLHPYRPGLVFLLPGPPQHTARTPPLPGHQNPQPRLDDSAEVHGRLVGFQSGHMCWVLPGPGGGAAAFRLLWRVRRPPGCPLRPPQELVLEPIRQDGCTHGGDGAPSPRGHGDTGAETLADSTGLLIYKTTQSVWARGGGPGASLSTQPPHSLRDRSQLPPHLRPGEPLWQFKAMPTQFIVPLFLEEGFRC